MGPQPALKKQCHWCSKLVGRDVPISVNTARGKFYFHKLCVDHFLKANPMVRVQMEQDILQRYR